MKGWVYCLMLFLLSGCIASGPAAPEGKALLVANYPIVAVDGEAVASRYSEELLPGIHSVTVVYRSYRWDYHCRFEWDAVSDQRYEVVDTANLYPLTLYRWVRVNALWAARYEPINPLGCDKQPAHSG